MIKVRNGRDIVIYDQQSGIMGIKNSDETPKQYIDLLLVNIHIPII